MKNLRPGENTTLPVCATLRVTVVGDRHTPDLFCVLLDGTDRADGAEGVAFYGHATAGAGSVVVDSSTNEISITPDRVPAAVQRLLFVAQADGVPTIAASVSVTTSIVVDGQVSVVVPLLSPADLPVVQLAEIYRRNGAWKVRALGDGYAAGMARLLEVHGIDVADDRPATPTKQRQDSRARPAHGGVAEPASTASNRGSAGASPRPASSRQASAADTRSSSPRRTQSGAATVPGRRQKGQPRAEADPTLRQAVAVAERIEADSAKVVSAVRQIVSDIHRAVLGIEPTIDGPLHESRNVVKRLIAEFDARYRNDRIGPKHVDGLVDNASRTDIARPSPIDLAAWMRSAESLINDICNTQVPLMTKARQQKAAHYRSEASRLLQERAASEHRWVIESYDEFASSAVAVAQSTLDGARDRLLRLRRAMAPVTPVVGSLANPDAVERIVPGVGPLRFQIGDVVLGPRQFTHHRPQISGYGIAGGLVPQQMDVPFISPADGRWRIVGVPFGIPAFIDLDRAGGLVTDDAVPINNLLLRAIALLPAGQFKTSIFDPERLGESASALFGLGDAAETIIGTKVRTTDRELDDLLQEMEEHITFVSQKYLQGSYDSLTEYNLAAGEVAEPYRALVLYDFPSGFVHAGGRVNDDAVLRLGKLIKAGPRCGVFPLVVAKTAEIALKSDVLAPLPKAVNGGMVDHQLFRVLTGAGGPSIDLVLRAGGTPPPADNAIDRALDSRRSDPLFTGEIVAHWTYQPEDPAPAATVDAILAHVRRGLASADDVKVTLDSVARLGRAKHDEDVRHGVRGAERLPDPDDPATWWYGSSENEVIAQFGRVGATGVAVLPVNNDVPGTVIGGRPGSGKSVLLHAMIASLTLRYSPRELQLYLVDFKEGVEFKVYANGGLPHARVVAVESDREFGVSVLAGLVDEIQRRGELFRSGSGEETGLGEYRRKTGESLPRIVAIVDEFHTLFERDDQLATRAGELMEKVVRLGRAFGIHLVLASQSLSGTSGLGRHTLGLLPGRIAMQSNEADARILMADDNADARLLTRAGEGILNLNGGTKDHNKRFQTAFLEPEDRSSLVAQLRAIGNQRGFANRPFVFEGNVPVPVDDLPADVLRTGPRGTLQIPVGVPLTLDGPVLAQLRREPGGNLLLVCDEDSATPVLGLACAVATAGGVPVDLVDYGAVDGSLPALVERLGAVELTRRRRAEAKLQEIRDLVQQRHQLSDFQSPSRLLVVSTLHRARDFDVSPEAQLLEDICKDGPDVGVHVVVWVDKPVSAERRIPVAALREMGLRLLGPMSNDDGFNLAATDLTGSINQSQMVFDDHDRGLTSRVRRVVADSGALERIARTR